MSLVKAKGTLGDLGSTVAVSVPVSENSGQLDVQSTTTSLLVRDSTGNTLVTVPQLWSTVDSGKTTWEAKGGMLTIILHKLDPREHWRSLEYQVSQVEQSRARTCSLRFGFIGPGLPEMRSIMKQHVKQKPFVQAESEPPPKVKEGSSEAALAAREQVKQLFQAAVAGDVERMQQVAPAVSAEGPNAVKDGNGRNALHFAAQAGQARAAEYLLDQEGIDVNAQDDSGVPLRRNVSQSVRQTLDYWHMQAESRQGYSGWETFETGSVIAASQPWKWGEKRCVIIGETALGLAAGAGHLVVVQLLLQHGADVSLLQDSRPQPLHRAAAEGEPLKFVRKGKGARDRVLFFLFGMSQQLRTSSLMPPCGACCSAVQEDCKRQSQCTRVFTIFRGT